MMLYKIPVENGMYFLHEHPWSARSWDEKCVRDVLELKGARVVKGDMCCFGMYQEVDACLQFVKEATGFVTNASGIADELSKQCEGDHAHVHLLNGRAKRAEVYPDELFSNFGGIVRDNEERRPNPRGMHWIHDG